MGKWGSLFAEMLMAELLIFAQIVNGSDPAWL